MRKEKGLTQSQLAEKINVSDKTISKWENGNRMPDLSFLESLSNALEITVSELLAGAKNENNRKRNVEDTSYNSIKYYTNESNKKIKKKYIRIIAIMVLVFAFILFAGYFLLNNYDNCYIYSVSSENIGYKIDGLITDTPEKKYIIINSISNDSDNELEMEEIYAFEYHLYYGKEMIYGNGDISQVVIDEYSELQYLDDVLNSISIYISGDANYFNFDFKKIDGKELKIEIFYINANKEQKQLTLPIKLTKTFSNDKLMYSGGKKF